MGISQGSFSSRVPGLQPGFQLIVVGEVQGSGLALRSFHSYVVGAPICSRHAAVYLRTCALPAFVSRLQHGLSEDATLKRNYKRIFLDFSGTPSSDLIAWTSQGLWEKALGDWISRAEQGRHKYWRAKPGCRALSCLPIPGWPSGSPTITWGCGSHAHLEPTSYRLGCHWGLGHSGILSWLAWNSREMYQLMNTNKACSLS